jgi:hypothetical protein
MGRRASTLVCPKADFSTVVGYTARPGCYAEISSSSSGTARWHEEPANTPHMKRLFAPFVVLAAVGLILSIVVHVSALLGFPSPLGEKAWILHGGIFVVWLPAVLAMVPLTRESKQRNLWRATLRGCPNWMRRMAYAFCGYAVVNFVVFIAAIAATPQVRRAGGSTPEAVFRGFSGHWMAFYSMALAILYSATRVAESDTQRRCFAGHPVSPAARYCEECGQPVRDVPPSVV